MIRIGIVGCGRILAAHLRGYRLLRASGINDFVITALTTRRPADALGYLDRKGNTIQRPAVSPIAGDPLAIGNEFISDFQDPALVQVYPDYAALAASADVDAVMDLTTHGMHHLVAEKVFAHRKHLLSQKPLAATMRAGRQMLDQANDAGVVFGTFECFRFMPQTLALDWLFRSGRGGRLQMMLYGYLGSWWAPDQIVAGTPWRHRKDEGGGITVDIGVHFFDQMRTLAGRPTWITGRTRVIEPIRRNDRETIHADADDTVWASVEFDGGAMAQVSASWAGHGGPATFGSGSVFFGSKGKVDGTRLMLDDGTEGDLVDLFCRESTDPPILAGVDDWFALAQHDWLDGIRQARTPISSGEEGLVNLAASLAILESDMVGRTVHFDEVWSGELSSYQDSIDQKLGLKDR